MSCEFLNLQEPNEGPYSDLVVVDGKFLFLSGLVSEDFETGELVSGDIATETRQALKNLAMILEQYGSDMDHVVRISHGNGYETYYGHNSSLTVSVGQKVYKGQQIARVGSTGNSTGNHCHFEVRYNGVAKNPLNYL